ncbi:MAG TPA: primosomal protein N' [Solirubrobacterales bacterium]|nr:primosomal protein N' [Solirubrobacterales bacterium]
MAIAKVEPLLTTRNVRGPFDYRLPEAMAGVEVGSILVVPFGRRRVKGVVVDLAESSEIPDSRLAEPYEALEAGVPVELVELGRWLADEYCSTPARGLGLTLPPGTGTGAVARRVRPLTELEAEITADGERALTGEARLGLRQKAALRALLAGPQPARRLATVAGADRAAIRRLEERGLVTTREVERRRRPAAEGVGAVNEGVELNDAQREAAERIRAALGTGGSLLLHGVTGSGKTEVYLTAAAEALERGMGVIALVPEIALTPQTVSRFQRRFGDSVALLHSRMPPGARYDEWRRLRSGEARVAVGPRSAVFAPVADLGLIVIDEEHDSSYKQESDPRYDARDVAARRAELAGAVLVAGSATPRPESWLATTRISLPERVDGRGLPPVDVVDMRETRGALHPDTLAALAKVRDAGEKAIVLINRRGWSTHLVCRSCGHAWLCPECDVSLVLHRGGAAGTRSGAAAGQVMGCHHCGHLEPAPESCPGCSSVTIARVGAGAERVESELAELLDPLEVFRLDADSAAGGGHGALLRRFEQASSGVLVGTQMVAKGHDFHEVTLGVVLDADGTLRLPDFRAEERTFSLITQLAGRSGRGERGGRVIVQTLSPAAPSIRRAAAHDAAGFLAEELARREALRYPPYSHLVELALASPREPLVEAAAEKLRALVAERLPGDAELLGPAPLFRRRGRHRRRLIVKATERLPAVSAVRDAVRAAVKARLLGEIAVSVDVDPQ